jgi:predicted HTH domain antitoxin
MNGVNIALAIKLFQNGIVSIGRAAKVAGMDREPFMDRLGALGIPVVDYNASDLAAEMTALYDE